MIIMFTYIQIIDKDAHNFMGYVDYEFKNNVISMTLVRGMRKLHRINIPLSDVTDIMVEEFYGTNRISFIYNAQKYIFLNSGYGENEYLIKHLTKAVKA
ncbi:hypothetical protein FC97_GL000529 [Companilactobacillus kimchii DSM 13961 = JCM 10707]|uniref:Bacterial Pleckstrin homology domain-containing protein n=2 Tax=Companilactobacillus kimchii TaxID=2801452 RepID=A0ABR5NTJ7_9LACO|nr:hypothetical protein FC97_GL000529 [Companilactobacillus kimchii DSM 13961 = JCM 10707]